MTLLGDTGGVMPTVNKISRVIGVGDMQAAKLFYVAALGLTVTAESDYWIDLSCGNGSLALSPNGSDRPPGQPGIERTKVIFEVTGLDELVRHIATLGGKVVHVSDNVAAQVKVVHVLDPFQNVFQLAERRHA
jgi:predicted enzyme related to lactoylglutathione lyase